VMPRPSPTVSGTGAATAFCRRGSPLAAPAVASGQSLLQNAARPPSTRILGRLSISLSFLYPLLHPASLRTWHTPSSLPPPAPSRMSEATLDSGGPLARTRCLTPAVLTDKRLIPLRSTSVRTPHLFSPRDSQGSCQSAEQGDY
jgi:hypothetical protein